MVNDNGGDDKKHTIATNLEKKAAKRVFRQYKVKCETQKQSIIFVSGRIQIWKKKTCGKKLATKTYNFFALSNHVMMSEKR